MDSTNNTDLDPNCESQVLYRRGNTMVDSNFSLQELDKALNR